MVLIMNNKDGNIIKRNNTGIALLEKFFNMKLEYSAHHNVFYENNDVIMQEFEDIEIKTKINDIVFLDKFVYELKKTDIYTMFNRIEIVLDMDIFHNTDDYFIMCHGEEFYNDKREWTRIEKYVAYIKK